MHTCCIDIDDDEEVEQSDEAVEQKNDKIQVDAEVLPSSSTTPVVCSLIHACARTSFIGRRSLGVYFSRLEIKQRAPLVMEGGKL